MVPVFANTHAGASFHSLGESAVLGRHRQRGPVEVAPGLRGSVAQELHDRARRHQIFARQARSVVQDGVTFADTCGLEKIGLAPQRIFVGIKGSNLFMCGEQQATNSAWRFSLFLFVRRISSASGTDVCSAKVVCGTTAAARALSFSMARSESGRRLHSAGFEKTRKKAGRVFRRVLDGNREAGEAARRAASCR